MEQWLVDNLIQSATNHCRLLRSIPYDESAAEEACLEVEIILQQIEDRKGN